MTALITGSGGLVGSSAVEFFITKGKVIGVDCNMRREFFGEEASVQSNLDHICGLENFENYHIDIRNYDALKYLFERYKFDLIIHTAAQPSHDKAADIPLLDFEVNALGTLNLLELT